MKKIKKLLSKFGIISLYLFIPFALVTMHDNIIVVGQSLEKRIIKYEAIHMKRALIMHGWGADPSLHWFPEEKKILEDMGYSVNLPAMPNKYNPKENEWMNVIKQFGPDEKSVLIGHSLGGTTILEYLETEDVKVDAVVLVVTPIEYTDVLEEDGFEGFKLHIKNLATDAFLEACDYEEIYDWEKIIIGCVHMIWKMQSSFFAVHKCNKEIGNINDVSQ